LAFFKCLSDIDVITQGYFLSNSPLSYYFYTRVKKSIHIHLWLI